MSALARTFCTSFPYRALARWVLLPWALQGFSPSGEALEIGSGSGAEAVRVLRPGGHLVGYDLFHAAPSRHSHHDEPGSMRMMGPGQLEAELRRLPIAHVRARRSVGGFALRFFATKG